MRPRAVFVFDGCCEMREDSWDVKASEEDEGVALSVCEVFCRGWPYRLVLEVMVVAVTVAGGGGGGGGRKNKGGSDNQVGWRAVTKQPRDPTDETMGFFFVFRSTPPAGETVPLILTMSSPIYLGVVGELLCPDYTNTQC